MTDRTTIQRQEDHLRRAEILERLEILKNCDGAHSQAALTEANGLRYELLGLDAERTTPKEN